jgi:hypothetical protein
MIGKTPLLTGGTDGTTRNKQHLFVPKVPMVPVVPIGEKADGSKFN